MFLKVSCGQAEGKNFKNMEICIYESTNAYEREYTEVN